MTLIFIATYFSVLLSCFRSLDLGSSFFLRTLFPPSPNSTPTSITHGWDFDIYEPPDISGTIKRKSSSSSDSSFSSSEVSVCIYMDSLQISCYISCVQMDVEVLTCVILY